MDPRSHYGSTWLPLSARDRKLTRYTGPNAASMGGSYVTSHSEELEKLEIACEKALEEGRDDEETATLYRRMQRLQTAHLREISAIQIENLYIISGQPKFQENREREVKQGRKNPDVAESDWLRDRHMNEPGFSHSVHKWGAVPPLREPRRGSPIDYGKPHGDGEYDEEDGFDEYEMDNGTWENSSRHSGVARR